MKPKEYLIAVLIVAAIAGSNAYFIRQSVIKEGLKEGLSLCLPCDEFSYCDTQDIEISNLKSDLTTLYQSYERLLKERNDLAMILEEFTKTKRGKKQ